MARGTLERFVGSALVKAYGPTLALRGVNVDIPAGALTLIEGANGSGKSTLLGIIGTVIRPTSGVAEFRPASLSLAQARQELGWLSHETLAYADLTGRENIELVAKLHGLDAVEAWSAVESRFELGSFARRPLRTCSRGQRQRIALARALVHRPTLILLDEPTTGLDKAGVDRLLRVIAEELQEGAGLCVVSHDADFFRDLAKHTIVLERGKRVVSRETSSATKDGGGVEGSAGHVKTDVDPPRS